MLHVMVVALGFLTAALALSDWYAVATARTRLERWSKPLTMLALVGVAAAGGAASAGTGGALLVALTLGLLGDVALLGRTRARFLAGLAFFLLGHLAYVVCFARLGLPSPGWSWLVVIVLALMLVVTRRLVPTAYRLAGPTLAVPIAVYTLVIAAMLVLAWLTGGPLLVVGATVFVVSDSVIAVTLATTDLGRPAGRAQLAVMVTYHVGQALIVGGVLHALD